MEQLLAHVVLARRAVVHELVVLHVDLLATGVAVAEVAVRGEVLGPQLRGDAALHPPRGAAAEGGVDAAIPGVAEDLRVFQ